MCRIDAALTEWDGCDIYPPSETRYSTFQATRPEDARVMIVGQDPYHGRGQANGMAFSVNYGIKIPPSLRNIFTELKNDVGAESPSHGNLSSWSEQGVVLMNSVLTVPDGQPGGHKNVGWTEVTDRIIGALSERNTGMVFLLWGNYAQGKMPLIDKNRHLVIASAHPSPFSARRGFFGSKPFSRTNEWLQSTGRAPINWALS
jgi:uracil-DNA glycosylase